MMYGNGRFQSPSYLSSTVFSARAKSARSTREVRERWGRTSRCNPHLVGIARADRHERHDVIAGVDEPLRSVGEFRAQVILEQSAAVAVEVRALLGEFARGDGRHEGVGVDLPVRVVQRDADLDAPVLEREDVLHVVARAELGVAVSPDLEEQFEVPRERHGAERGLRVLREDDNLAGPEAGARVHDDLGRVVRERRQRREHVLEDRDLPRPLGHLGRVLRIARGRASGLYPGGGRNVRFCLCAGVRDPLAAQRVPAQMRVRIERAGVRARCVERVGQRLPAVEDERPAGLAS